MFEMSKNNPQPLHNTYTCQTYIKMSFGAKLDILTFITNIFIFNNFGCQQAEMLRCPKTYMRSHQPIPLLSWKGKCGEGSHKTYTVVIEYSTSMDIEAFGF
jgi:hypothetical protein